MVKASDISDEAFLAALEPSGWTMRWDLTTRLGFPPKVVLAKARSMMRRGLINGCDCGCRGDFERTPNR